MNVQRRRLVGPVAAGLCTVLAAVGLCGCGGSSPGSKDVTLHMVAADYGDPKTHNSSTQFWNTLVQGFEQKNPHIKVDVQVVDWDHVDDRVTTMVKAGAAPDIAQIGSYADYAAKGLLYSADDIFPISMQADFIPSLVTAGSVNRVQYGIPWASSSRLFFYNKRLFKDAGIAHGPTTWADVAHDAAKLKQDGVRTPYGLPLGPEEAQAESLMWMLGAGGGFTDNAGGYTFDSPANVTALSWLKDNLVTKGLTGPGNPATTNRRTVFADFLAGDVGMIDGHPTLLAQAKAAHIDVGVTALPGREAAVPQTLGVADWMMAFKQKSDHLAADSAFLRYVYSPENSLRFIDQYGLLPVTTTASQAMARNPKDKDMLQFLDQLPNAIFYPVDKTSWGPVSDRVKKTIGAAVHDDPQQVLGALQRFAAGQGGK